MSDFGRDFSALPDQAFSLQEGLPNLAEAIARRLMTPRGGLFYDPSYGLDVRQYLNEANTVAVRFELASLVEAECEKDPRVLAATVEVETLDTRSVRLRAALTTAEGPFPLVIRADELTVEVLREPV
jgi:phage baseplate assembly protein W